LTTERTPTLNIEWGQINPKAGGGCNIDSGQKDPKATQGLKEKGGLEWGRTTYSVIMHHFKVHILYSALFIEDCLSLQSSLTFSMNIYKKMFCGDLNRFSAVIFVVCRCRRTMAMRLLSHGTVGYDCGAASSRPLIVRCCYSCGHQL